MTEVKPGVVPKITFKASSLYGAQTGSGQSAPASPGKKQTAVTSSIRAALLDIVDKLSNLRNRNGRNLGGPFKDLPTAVEAPQYYDVIRHPRSLRQIKQAVKENLYSAAEEAYVDMRLVWRNAQTYNNHSSTIAKDADRLQAEQDTLWADRVATGELPVIVADMSDLLNPSAVIDNMRAAGPARIYPSDEEEDSAGDEDDGEADDRNSRRDRESEDRRDGDGDEDESMLQDQEEKDVKRSERKAREQNAKIWDSETGWMTNHAEANRPGYQKEILSSILDKVMTFEHPATNRRLARCMLTLSEEARAHPLVKGHHQTIDLNIISARLKAGSYSTADHFDRDMTNAFATARKWISPKDRLAYGDTLYLQRIYQDLSRGDGTSRPISYEPADLATLPVAPGTSREVMQAAENGNKVLYKDRQGLHGINYKGNTYAAGEWVLLHNPLYSHLPIVAQIFKMFVDRRSSRRVLELCYYYRPEETVHAPNRVFLADEVFKTSTFFNINIEDVLGRCMVMFLTRYIRGRLQAPLWTPDIPLYVCEHRYKDDKEHTFKKIKSWASCVCEEARKVDLVYQTDPPVSVRRVASPFLSGVEGPGHLGAADPSEEEDQLRYYAPVDKTGAPRLPPPMIGPSTPSDQGIAGPSTNRPKKYRTKRTIERELLEQQARARGDLPATPQPPMQSPQPQPQPSPMPTSFATQPSLSSSYPSPRAIAPQYAITPQTPRAPEPVVSPADATPLPAPQPVKTEIITDADKAVAEDRFAVMPAELASLFRTDPFSGDLIWYTTPAQIRIPPKRPFHSLAYLEHLARQRAKKQ
ncbi:uncharacterized protein L969DRAFT_88668 [Mixia osmundae IAM 14324]|nr:uncharacterized protein L969DRAFT_88668 [Mixia osmundae IAM 14324]KEI38231.1 hypothetical protein L969DRAFT_88668 [Mixia osmundae IAM 14324]